MSHVGSGISFVVGVSAVLGIVMMRALVSTLRRGPQRSRRAFASLEGAMAQEYGTALIFSGHQVAMRVLMENL